MNCRAGGIAQPIKCCFPPPKALCVIPQKASQKRKSWVKWFIGEVETDDPWGSLARQLSIAGEFQPRDRHRLRKQDRWNLRNDS